MRDRDPAPAHRPPLWERISCATATPPRPPRPTSRDTPHHALRDTKPRMKLQPTLATLAIIAMLLLGAHALRGDGPPPPHSQHSIAVEDDADANQMAATHLTAQPAEEHPQSKQPTTPPPSAPQHPTSTPPLPPLDAPLADILDELRDRADAGDVAAACRLSTELSQCARVAGFNPRHYEPAFAEQPHERELRLERLQRDSARHQHCQGLPDGLLVQQARFHLDAAQLGDTDAALRFLYARWLEPATLIHDPSLAHLYREHAWPLFLRLFEDGVPHAALLWADATRATTQRIPLAAVMPEQWRRPDVANALVQEITGHSAMAHDRDPPPSAESHAEATDLFRRHFAPSPHYHGGAPPPPPLIGNPEDCEALRTL